MIYSKRNRPTPESYRYDIPHDVRNRILYAIQGISNDMSNSFDFERMLDDVGQKLLVEYGGLAAPGYEAARVSNNPVIQHFFSCDDDMALDFLEAAFQTIGHCGGQRTVEAINTIFRDSAIGYELTPFVMKVSDRPGKLFGINAGKELDITYPQVITKESEFLHTDAMQPTIELLNEPGYEGANEEFLKAHEHYRHGRNSECLVDCLKAFESTMKIICDAKGWTYKQTDTASKLIKVCLDNGLVPTFSEQQLTSLRTLLESGVPTTRNKLGGHGQGKQRVQVSDSVARYVLHLTAATILLLAESADT